MDFRKETRTALRGKGVGSDVGEKRRSAAERPERHLKVKVTMNVDGDIVRYFKDRAMTEGRPYQTLINETLREFIEGSRAEKLAEEVGRNLLENRTFLDSLREKLKI